MIGKKENYVTQRISKNWKCDMPIERIVKYVDLTPEQKENLVVFTEMEDGVVFDPMRIDYPDWLAVTCNKEEDGEGRFWLFFLYKNGKIIDYAHGRDSIEEAMAEVEKFVNQGDWISCDVAVDPDDDLIPRNLIG